MRRILSLTLLLAPVPAVATDKPRTPTADLAPPDEVVRMVNTLGDQILTPGGPPAPAWDQQGVDLIARLAAALGGPDLTALISETAGDRSVDHYGRGAVPLPPGLETLLDLPGRAMPGDVAWQSVSELGDGLWMRTRARLTQRGNALCGQGWESLTILAPANAPLSDEMRFAVMVVRLLAQRMAAIEVCAIAFELPDGRLQQRSFLSDGRPLPKLDEDMVPVRIRPLADAPAILTP